MLAALVALGLTGPANADSQDAPSARAAEPVDMATSQYARPPKEAWKVELLKQPLRAYCIDIAALIPFYLGKPVDPPPPWPEDLRCEYLENPFGIDAPKPRLSWKLRTGTPETERGIKQTAYQVLVASSRALLRKDHGDLWDSGKVESDQSVHVEYHGKPLESGMQSFWKVKVWTLTSDLRPLTSSSPSDWSEPALWTMGLLKPSDWQGEWIRFKEADEHRNTSGTGRSFRWKVFHRAPSPICARSAITNCM